MKRLWGSIICVLLVAYAFKAGFLVWSQPTSPEEVSSPPVVSPTPTLVEYRPIITPSSVPQAKPAVILKPTPLPKPKIDPSEVFNLINAYRSANGLPALSISDELCRIAEQRADYMMQDHLAAFKTSKVGGHTGFKDTTYSGDELGENLAANVISPGTTIDTWKASPPHNALLLSTSLDGTQISKGCVASRVADYGSIVVLEVGDR